MLVDVVIVVPRSVLPGVPEAEDDRAVLASAPEDPGPGDEAEDYAGGLVGGVLLHAGGEGLVSWEGGGERN